METERRDEAARRHTLRRDGARPIGVNIEEGAALARQAGAMQGIATSQADADPTPR